MDLGPAVRASFSLESHALSTLTPAPTPLEFPSGRRGPENTISFNHRFRKINIFGRRWAFPHEWPQEGVRVDHYRMSI